VADYIPRLADAQLDELLGDHPAVLLVGPRACGKTTTAQRHSRGRLRLDRPAEAAAARIDPDAVLGSGPFPLLVDEWQFVPEILGAIKRAVDEGAPTGRFVVTGSSQADLTAAGWPATGRLIRLRMYGLVESEIERTAAEPFLERLVDGALDALAAPYEAPDVRAYLDRALRGGLPESALASSERARRRWLSSYLDQMVARDVALLGAVRDPMRLRRYLQALAANTAGTPTLSTLIDSAGIDRETAVAYDTLLEQLFITERLPAWSTNRLSRLTHLPKRHLVEPAFIGPLLGVDARAALRDGDLLGRILDSFVTAQLRAEGAASDFPPQLFHVRDANGRHEVDMVAELADGRIVGIEIKASAAPSTTDARHLHWLRAALGDRFAAGAVLHTGPRAFRLDDGILAVPICALWADSTVPTQPTPPSP
jgi:predicted AAA+ superfamily ATPase